MNAFTLQAVPSPDTSMAVSYLSRKSLGSESPSNCGRMVGLKRGGHGISSNSTERGWWGSVVGNAVVGEVG